jgi:hypothetical protein
MSEEALFEMIVYLYSNRFSPTVKGERGTVVYEGDRFTPGGSSNTVAGRKVC